MKCDIAIIGGGPAGSTTGALLKKYNPNLDVAIFERELFPRDHVGESLLPMVTSVLHESGAWEKVEAANFPIKLGAAYRWGKQSDEDLYYFHFLRSQKFETKERPGKYEGQRREATFQVDRSIYDKILLDHAAELACRVYQQAKVAEIQRDGDRVLGLKVNLQEGEQRVEARHYVDASGGESLMRRTMGVGTASPTSLRNIAIWDYWQNAEWAETVGGEGTYVYVLSIGPGWIWFIPLGPTRTSIGFVTSAEHYRESGKSTEQIYLEAISQQPLVRQLTRNANREHRLQATKDWSFVADRLHGENWFLAGDACGFADPILAAGLTLAQVGARRVAYSILEIEHGSTDPEWIKDQYDEIQRRNTNNHIRFADYWYSANEQFTDLKEYCSQIAEDAGLTLDADAAFRWLGTGGFADELSGLPTSGTFTVSAIKGFTSRFSAGKTSWSVFENNLFEIDVEGAENDRVAMYDRGSVHQLPCLRKGTRVWPLSLVYKCVYNALSREVEIQPLAERFILELQKENFPISEEIARACLETLESLVTEGWVKARFDPSLPLLDVGRP